MERRAATSEMSFVHEGLSHKPIFGCNHNDMRDRREASDTHPHHFLARCTIVDDSSELSIFDAKKYFNEVSTNNINKVSPVTSIDPMLMLKGQSEDQDSDKDSELSRSKPWTCGGVTPPSSVVASKFSPVVASIDGYRQSYRARSFHSTTPTASSEASWNSQTGLLSNPPGAISVSVLRGDSSPHSQKKTRKPPMSSSITGRWIFGSSKCPCIGKKSVQVHESKVILDPKARPYINNNNTTKDKDNYSESECSSWSKKTSSDNTMFLQHSDNNVIWSTQKCVPPNLLLQGPTTQRVIASTSFSFPILKNKSNSNNEDHFSIRSINPVLIQDPPRDSLEVFKPSSVKDGNGDNDLKSRILANVAVTGGNATIISDIDDMASDASSDLFEIESFSTQTASTTTISYSSMFHRRDSMELEARRLGLNAAATHCSLDEPMTPSTDWYEPSEASIDWSVTTAEGFDRASIANMSEVEEPWTEKNNINKNNNHRRRSSSGNGLLSCRSEKAVSVGPQPVTKHVGSRPPLGKKPPTPVARSSSARHSLTFAA
ncbi:protein PHYTOCHROME KINASE SUBSTRATE 4-like [Cucurbita pepo subsp. pepo]|uniref:protein PHYTOCHROME KINASE SUBSTRATE 4-like n=1 Tax=Cucurbita pepo subsp. pepo TaxID=3664 RepID=UPI000C9D9973|nr:protein PHYTOCHROME KINASE SUBSTRATE 4-like [Cucurbita pepo subsp. pepo]XP_023539561.1 protein PHYTOCHROME KINASE SUBSTRATE 4-like [Cucurbita pepo subsp. pepo]